MKSVHRNLLWASPILYLIGAACNQQDTTSVRELSEAEVVQALEAELEQEAKVLADSLSPDEMFRSSFPEDLMLIEPWPQAGSDHLYNTRPIMLYIDERNNGSDTGTPMY